MRIHFPVNNYPFTQSLYPPLTCFGSLEGEKGTTENSHYPLCSPKLALGQCGTAGVGPGMVV